MSDDDEHENFIQAGELPPLSMPAFQLHTFAIIESFQRGVPGFVSDDYLEAIPAETTLTAAELEMAGVWVRREGGYFVQDDETISMVLGFREKSDANAEKCLTRGHHVPRGDGDWIVCETCHVPLKRPDGKPVGGAHGEAPDYGPRRDDLAAE